MKQYCWVISSLILCFSVWSCKDTLPDVSEDKYDVTILVTDEKNRPLRDVNLTFYRTELDMQTNINPVVGFANAKTDANGKYRLLSYDLGRNDFFVSAEYEQQNNWDSLFRIKQFEYGQPQQFKTIIRESIASTLAGRGSKRWQQTSFKVNGVESQSCVYRQTWEFQRSLHTLLFYNNTEFCGNNQQVGQSYWRILSNNKAMNVITSGIAINQTMTFTVLNNKLMRFYTTNTNPANGQVFTSEYEFKAIQ